MGGTLSVEYRVRRIRPGLDYSSSRVPKVAIRRFRLANLSRPETCCYSRKTCGAHRYLATLSNYREDREEFVQAQSCTVTVYARLISF
jgi:hypothetical protein